MSSLSPREREVVSLRYGIGTDQEHSFEEIGRRFGVSRERIRQLEAKALTRLRDLCGERDLESFLEV